MKKFIILLFALFAIFTAKATDFVYEGLKYSTTRGNTCSLVGYDGAEPVGNLIIPETVQDQGKTYSVTSIGIEAFASCTDLTSVIIGNSVTSIGRAAFNECRELTSVIIGNSVTSIGSYTFYSCGKLTSVIIGNSVTSIGEYAFYGCSELTNIEIPDSVTSIGEYAFLLCEELTSVIIGNSVTYIGEYAFYGCSELTNIEIPDSVTSICSYTFYSCGKLKSVIIGNSVTSIGSNAFSLCEELTNVEIPNSVTSIGSSAFFCCSGLTNIEIPNSVTHIGLDAFYGCSELTSVIIGNSVTRIGLDAFYGCDKLIKCAYPNTISNPFENCNIIISYPPEAIIENGFIYSEDGTFYFAPLTLEGEYALPASVTSIGSDAFSCCVDLTSVIIGNSVTSIGEYAFYGCSELTNIEIPDSVTSIGEYAFEDCTGLRSVYLPHSLQQSGSGAFSNCSSLKRVDISDLSAYCKIQFLENTTANPLYYAHHLYLNGEEIIDLVIPEDITEIGFGTFYNGLSIRSIEIPGSIKTINAYSLSSTGISSITIPPTVENFSGLALAQCKNLKAITFSQSDVALNIINGDLLQETGIETLNLGRNLNLNENATLGLTSLKNVNLGGAITGINDGLFKGNKSLTNVVIPSSVTYIGESAFENCNLNSISIGAGIEEIGDYAFAGSTPSTIAVTAIDSPVALNTTFSYTAGELMVTPGYEEEYYNNPNCWYQFSYPTPLVEATSLNVSSSASGGLAKLSATMSPSDASLPYVIWISEDTDKATVDPDGTVHFYGDAVSCDFTATTLYADGPVMTFTLEKSNAGILNIVDSDWNFTGQSGIYTLQGIQIHKEATNDNIKALNKGIYIINGKKVMIQ